MTTSAPQLATFAAGCFWGVEENFRTRPGVLKTVVGYSGGKRENPNYEQVCSGATGHAEALQITYDPDKISYEELLEIFWNTHNPTTRDRQGPDIGTQYRSVIFYHTPEQERLAQDAKKALNLSGRWSNPVVTEIVPAQPFYAAEEYHQQYLLKHGRASCHI